MQHEELFLESFQDAEDAVYIRCRSPRRKVEKTFAEARRAARSIYLKAKQQRLAVQLCLSGGIDSEAMAEAFLAEKIPFEAVTLRFQGGWNDYDIAPAIDFCRRHGLHQVFVDLDVKEFLESGAYLIYARKYRCNSYQICVHLWFLDQLKGLPVLGGQQFTPVFRTEDLRTFNTEKGPTPLPQKFIGLSGDRQLSYERYSRLTGRTVVANFMQYTPELALSHQDLPLYRELIEENLQTGDIDLTYEKKCRWYAQAGFKARPKLDKFTGFEKLRHHYALIGGDEWHINQLYRKDLESEMPSRMNVWWSPFLLTRPTAEPAGATSLAPLSRRQAVTALASAAGLFGAFLLSPQTILAAPGWPCNCDADCKGAGGGKCGGGRPWDCGYPILMGQCLPPE